MCGRFIVFAYDEVLDIMQGIEVGLRDNRWPDWPARPVSAHPGTTVPVIVDRSDTERAHAINRGALEVRELTWGFEAPWNQSLVFNTRLDSAQKPLWRDAMAHRRCIIACRAFFEASDSETVPSRSGGGPVRRHYEFRLPGNAPILIGGIWQQDRFSMVTTEPNAAVAPIHRRMPLVIRPEEAGTWLGPAYRTLADRTTIPLEATSEGASATQLSLI